MSTLSKLLGAAKGQLSHALRFNSSSAPERQPTDLRQTKRTVDDGGTKMLAGQPVPTELFAQPHSHDAEKLAANRMIFFPRIDYDNHPQYRSFVHPEPVFAAERRQYFGKVFQGLVGQQMRLLGYQSASSAGVRRATGDISPEGGISGELARHGIASLRLSSNDRNAVYDWTSEAVAILDKRRSELPAELRGVESISSSLAHIKRRDAAYEFYNDLLSRCGVFSACRDYRRVPYQLKFVSLQINEFSDDGIATSCRFEDGSQSRAYYLHLDSSVGAMKVIVYRSERVTAENGAFRYFPGSHRVLSPVELLIRKANDKCGYDSLKQTARAGFMALPPEARSKANFGNDLFDDGAIDRLLEREHICDSSEGDLLLFDNDGLHRGAIFNNPQGRREILQFLLIPKPSNQSPD